MSASAPTTTTQPLKLVAGARAVAFAGDDLLDIAKERAPDPAVFDERAPFFWRAEISNSNLDFYFTRMSETTLTNFAEDSTAGVAFQDSHDYRKLGFGRSLRGQYIAATNGEVTEDGYPLNRTHADFATLRGLNLNGVTTDSFIDGVRSGILSDVSVGFWATDVRCSICGGEMYQGWFGIWGKECKHIPGMAYQVTNEAGEPLIDQNGNEVKRVAFAWIMDGRLSEVSIVYDGATPSAAVLKAELLAGEGRLTDGERSMIERRYRTRLPVPTPVYAVNPGGVMVPTEGANSMGRQKPNETPEIKLPTTARYSLDARDKDGNPVPVADDTQPVTNDAAAVIADETEIDDLLDERAVAEPETNEPEPVDAEAELADIRALYAQHGIRIGRDPNAAIRALADKLLEYRDLAAVGKRYRTDLEAKAETELVRARGEAAKVETYRAVFARATVDELLTFIEDFGAEAATRLKGGRATVDTDDRDAKIVDFQPKEDARAYRA